MNNNHKKHQQKPKNISLSAVMSRRTGIVKIFRLGETGVGEMGVGKMGQIIGETGAGKMGVIRIK